MQVGFSNGAKQRSNLAYREQGVAAKQAQRLSLPPTKRQVGSMTVDNAAACRLSLKAVTSHATRHLCDLLSAACPGTWLGKTYSRKYAQQWAGKTACRSGECYICNVKTCWCCCMALDAWLHFRRVSRSSPRSNLRQSRRLQLSTRLWLM